MWQFILGMYASVNFSKKNGKTLVWQGGLIISFEKYYVIIDQVLVCFMMLLVF